MLTLFNSNINYNIYVLTNLCITNKKNRLNLQFQLLTSGVKTFI